MSDANVEHGVPEALAEPESNVKPLFLATLALANVGIMIAFFTPIQNLIPRMAEGIASDGSGLTKEAILSTVLAVGVIGSVIGNPLAGALSDRTTSRFGRRRPWMLGGSLLGLVGLIIMPNATNVIVLTLLWLAVQFAVNAAYAGLTATLPDQVPIRQRGAASGLIGFAQALGPVLGVGLVTAVVLALNGGFWIVGILFVALMLPFMFVLKDPPLPKEYKPEFHMGEFLKGFYIDPRKHPDFGWAWLARFLVSLGLAMAVAYLLFYLTDHLGFSSDENADDYAGPRQTVMLGIYAFGSMLTAVIGGFISDRTGKRKIFVIISTIIIAIAAVILGLSPAEQSGYTTALIAAVVLGIGYGWYLAVDQALISQVLPTAGDRARDLGVINIANSMPQVLAPVLAGIFVTSLGGYPALYFATAVITLAGAFAVMPIKSVP
jgi:MFS family permease